jgi:hypothetical protein
MRLFRASAAALFAAMHGLGAARADEPTITLGPPTYSEQSYAIAGKNGGSYSLSREGAAPGRAFDEFGAVSGVAKAFARQRVEASGSVTESDGGQDSSYPGEGFASLSYSFAVVQEGSDTPAPIEIDAFAIGASSAMGQGQGDGFFQLVQPTTSSFGGPTLPAAVTIINWTVCSGVCANWNGAPASFNRSQTLNLMTDTGYVINLTVAAGAVNIEGPAPFSGSASAKIDPYFALDASVPDPNAYTLVFSDGIINSPDNIGSAPEPSTWAMLLLGFIGLGYPGYRRRCALARA